MEIGIEKKTVVLLDGISEQFSQLPDSLSSSTVTMTERRVSYSADIENGPQQDNARDLDHKQDTDEYIALDRYISTVRVSRRQSIASQSDGDSPDNKKIPWWAPWRRRTKKDKEKEDSGGSGDDGTFLVPGDWLKTNIHDGLQEGDIESRRKKTGWNELTAEKESMFRKFLGYFQGPILYGWC